MLVAVPETEFPNSERPWMEPRDLQEAELLSLFESGVTLCGITDEGKYGRVGLRDGTLFIESERHESD